MCRPSIDPDEAWEQHSMLKGPRCVLYARAPAQSVAIHAGAASGYEGRDATCGGPRSIRHRYRAMLSAFEQARGSTSGSEPSVVERVPYAPRICQQGRSNPGLCWSTTPRRANGRCCQRSAKASVARRATRPGSDRGPRLPPGARDQELHASGLQRAGPATEPEEEARPRHVDAEDAAVIALSIVGLAEVGCWIGWRVTNPPPASRVASRGAGSSQAATVEPIATPPAPAPRAKNTPRPVAHAKAAVPAPAPASTKGATPPPADREGYDAPAPESTATAGSGSGWVTMPLSPPVEVFERGRGLASRDGRVSVAGRASR